jgi:hypothetical protein
LVGAVHVTVALASPAEATTPVGAAGTAPGVTAAEAAEAAPTPALFVAVTVNVYATPLVRFNTVQVVAPVVVHVRTGVPPTVDALVTV